MPKSGETGGLRLQFGDLSPAQRRYIPDPTQVIAETVRTSYDEVNLRGVGFIYISADSGPLKPASTVIDENRWAFNDGIMLYRVLAHELGHMFGLQHSGGEGALMGAMHPEAISRKNTISELATHESTEVRRYFESIDVFGFVLPYTDVKCLPETIKGQPVLPVIHDVQKKFFGMPQDWNCYRLDFVRDQLTVYGAPHPGDHWEYLGATAATEVVQIISQVLIHIHLPVRQQIFTKLTPTSVARGYLDGPSVITRYIIKAPYRTMATPLAPAWLKATLMPNQGYELEGVVNGRIEEFQIHAT